MTSIDDASIDDGPEVLVLVDPQWTPSEGEPDPPLDRIVGGWPLTERAQGRFVPNPEYVPLEPGSPTDPIDAVLQLMARGVVDDDELLAVLDSVPLSVALDEDGSVMVAAGSDGALVVPVTTSARHRAGLLVAGWCETTLAELAATLPASGVDVLLNPGAPASMRVPADAVRTAAARP